MNKSQRIKLNYETKNYDKHIKIRLEQNIDSLEFLSMNIDTEDVYRNFNADYGVLVGRVIANEGVGVPNAKISVFIPLQDEDSNDSEIKSIYPYKNPRDKNNDGKRYNLLPRVSKFDESKNDFSPKQPFGSFPLKEEIITNESYLNVYKKYYKYTALTNSAGDYMIFGVPVGTQTIHLSVDITDIGEYSMTPAAMVNNLGYPASLFTNDLSRLKPSEDLDDLPNIETQEISVDIIPFWGDTENFEIGITQQNFRIRSTIASTFVIFGNSFTDGETSTWGSDRGGSDWNANRPLLGELYWLTDDRSSNISIASKRIGKVTEKIYYYPNTITDEEINSGFINGTEPLDPTKHMLLLDTTEYSSYKREGEFVFIINCNRNKIVTDDYGNQISVLDNSTSGVFTQFRGFVTFEITEDELPLPPNLKIGDGDALVARMKIKVPQSANWFEGLDYDKDNNATRVKNTQNWRKQHYLFTKNNYYSVAKFHGLVYNNKNVQNTSSKTINGKNSGFVAWDNAVNDATVYNDNDPYSNTNIIMTSNFGNVENSIYEFPANSFVSGKPDRFGGNWLNLTLHLPQFSYLISEYSKIDEMRTSTNFRTQLPSDTNLYRTYNGFYLPIDRNTNNQQGIAAGEVGTDFFTRSDLHWTNFIEVPIEDIRKMKSRPKKGFTSADVLNLSLDNYHGGVRKPSDWKLTTCPEGKFDGDNQVINGGRINGKPTNNPDPKVYFFKGLKNADCINYLFELGLVSEK